MTVRVLVADDQRLVREGIAVLLDAQPDMDVVALAEDGMRAIHEVEHHRPDIVLMDVRMPVMDGIEATRRIAAAARSTRVIMLTTFDLDEYVYAALRAGASGFLLKESSAQALSDAVRVVARGDALLAPSVTRRLLEEFAARADPPAPVKNRLAGLTGREIEVLTLIARGRSNLEIAGDLVISEQTAKSHVSRILDKLHLRDRTQAAIFAYEARLVTPR